MKQKILTSSSNIGMGLWTGICVMFCSLLGRESLNYKKKQDRVLSAANKGLELKIKALGQGYHFVDYRVTWSSSLSVTVSALAVNECEEEIVKTEEPKPDNKRVEEAPKKASGPLKSDEYGWYCTCGGYNRIDKVRCQYCYREKPKQ